jgi:hypothetical protein
MSALDKLRHDMEILNRVCGDTVLIISALCLAAPGLSHVETSDAWRSGSSVMTTTWRFHRLQVNVFTRG